MYKMSVLLPNVKIDTVSRCLSYVLALCVCVCVCVCVIWDTEGQMGLL